MIGMTGIRRFVLRMGLFLAMALMIGVFLLPVLSPAFLHNPGLNGVILGVLAIGIVFIFRQVLMLQPEIEWVDTYLRGKPTATIQTRLLAPMVSMLGDRRGRLTLTATTMRSLLDSIGSRLDEGRDISRYMIGLLVLLGLLGTFWGLIQTVGSVGDVVGRLSFGGTDAAQAFEDLKSGLATPLAGMGTAFSSSLFGLAGSLILGFLDLQAGQAQNRFYNELEEWLSSQTKLGGPATAGAEGEPSVPAYIQALLEQTADGLDQLQRTIQRAEEGRAGSAAQLQALAERLGTLTDQMRTEQSLLARLAEAQLELRPILARLAQAPEASGGVDETARAHLRNLEIYAARMTEEMTQGRNEIVNEIRSAMRLLARTVAALAGEQER